MADNRTNTKRMLRLAFRVIVCLVVIYFLALAINDARAQLADNKFAISDVRIIWLLYSALSYLAGLLLMSVVWHRILGAMDQRPRFLTTMTAYFIGHLGKYVPGKAMVVVIRADLLRSDNVNGVVAAISVFAETLTMMAVGAFLAATLIGISFSDQTLFLFASVAIMLGTGVPTWPPVFRWIIKTFKIKRLNPDVDQALAGYTWNVVAFAWGMNVLSWACLAGSLYCVLVAISVDPQMSTLLPLLLRCLAAVSLATVAGFLSLIPGGILVRELVIEELLATPIGKAGAIVSAVLLRLIWLTVELISAGLLYTLRRKMCNSKSQ